MTAANWMCERSRWARWLIGVAGWLAVIATLALMSPGVVATANAESAAAQAGPACQAGAAEAERQAIHLNQWIEQLRAQAPAPGGAHDDDVVVLNNRGFNYQPAPPPEPAAADDGDR